MNLFSADDGQIRIVKGVDIREIGPADFRIGIELTDGVQKFRCFGVDIAVIVCVCQNDFLSVDLLCAFHPADEVFLKELFASIEADPQTEVEVNLPAQTITNKATGKSETFEINAYKKHCLMNGLDDIDFLVENKDKIEAFEKARN